MGSIRPESVPRTRKFLMDALWALYSDADYNIFREGPNYVVTVRHAQTLKTWICATHIRCIDSLSVADWKRLLDDKRATILKGG